MLDQLTLPIRARWHPKSEQMQRAPLAKYDQLRENSPIAHSDMTGWTLFRHVDLMDVLLDPTTFSSEVSHHISVPNSIDPPEHQSYRKIIEPFFTNQQMAEFEPKCIAVANQLLDSLYGHSHLDWMQSFAIDFAAQIQCEFMGWSRSMGPVLQDWTKQNQDAIYNSDKKRLAHLASEFTKTIRQLLKEASASKDLDSQTVTTKLARQRINGRLLHEKEIVSILRNWTVGEIGTISASIGIIIGFLAKHPDIQKKIRKNMTKLDYAIEEILRLDGPLPFNRRRTTKPVTFYGQSLPTNTLLTLSWIAANRDGRVFDEPETFKWGRDLSQNLLYGAGIHECPGAPLARLELRIALEQILMRSDDVKLIDYKSPKRSTFVIGGYAVLPVNIKWR